MAVSVDGVAIVASEEFANVGVGCLGWHRHVDARDFEVRIRWRWTISLHVVQPWRWHVLLNAKGSPQGWAEMAWLEILHPNLIFFTLKIYIAMGCLLGLFLIFEESIVKHLVIDVDLAHLRLHTLPHFLLQSLCVIGCACLLSQLANARLLDKVWQFKWYLMYAPLILEIPPLLGPMPRHRH